MIGNNVILRIAKEVSVDVYQHEQLSSSTIADKIVLSNMGARK